MSEYINDEYKRELDDIRLTVHRLESTKQNKWPLPLVLTVAIWCVGVTSGGAWWAATITEGLVRLEKTIDIAASDRYRKTEALADFALRDQITDYLENRISGNEDHLIQLEKELDKLRDEVRDAK